MRRTTTSFAGSDSVELACVDHVPQRAAFGDHFALAFAALIAAGAAMYAPYGPFFALVTVLLPRNVAGSATAFVNSTGALGGFVARPWSATSTAAPATPARRTR